MERTPKKRSGKDSYVRAAIIAGLVALALGITAIVSIPSLRERNNNTDSGSTIVAQGDDSLMGESDDGIITYEGNKYIYNSHLSNYLFLGIDTEGDIMQERETLFAGQSDTIILVAYDRKEETARVLSIPRDTMTEISVYNHRGEYVGPTKDHLTLQYAYGDGREKSCTITRDAVSNLLYGVPIIGYASINLDSIPLLVDAVGGVTLVVPDDSMEEVNPEYRKGEEITLTSETAERYLRYRDTHSHQQALVRMERQKSFVNAFVDRVIELQKQDPHTVTGLYETLKPQMVTNMSNDIFLDLIGARRMGEIVTIPGEGVATELFDEFHVDEKALYELILDVFYVEVTQ